MMIVIALPFLYKNYSLKLNNMKYNGRKTFDDFKELILKENGYSSWNDFRDKVASKSVSTTEYLETIQDAADRYALYVSKDDSENFNTEIPKSI